MRVAVRVIELAGQLQIPNDLNEYDGVRLYLAIRGEIKGETTIWNAHQSLLKKRFSYPPDFGSWLMLSHSFFSPLGTPPIPQDVIKGLLCAKAGISSEGVAGEYYPDPPPLPPRPSLVKPMDLCFVSIQYPPETNYGGIGTFMHTAARNLARRGHHVTVLSAAHDGQTTQKLIEGVRVVRISEPGSHSLLRDDWRRNLQTWQAIKEFRPQVVQLVDYQAEGFLLSLLNPGKYGVVTRLVDHATLTKARYETPFTLRREGLHLMGRQQAKHSQALFSPSVRLARQIERDINLKSDAIRQIVTGLNLSEMQELGKAAPALKLDEPYIIYFGRLEERKGITYLARALPLVWAKFPDLKVVFAGQYDVFKLEGRPARAFIEQIAANYAANLIFSGQLSRSQVLPLVARAKLSVLPSIWEPYAHTCIESIVLGVPVVTTGDSGGNAEIVAGLDDAEAEADSVPAGWLVPRRNPQALAEAIIQALSDETEYARILENTQRRAQRFDAEKMCDKLELLYQEVYQKL